LILIQKAFRIYLAKLKALQLKATEESRRRNHLKAKLGILSIEHCNQDLEFPRVLSKKYNRENYLKNQVSKLAYSKSIFTKIIRIQANIKRFILKRLFEKIKEKMLFEKSYKLNQNRTTFIIRKHIIPLSTSKKVLFLQSNIRILLAKNLRQKLKFEDERRKASLLSSKMKFLKVENINQITFSNILNKKNCYLNSNSNYEFKKYCYSTSTFKIILI
jgi:hypothetical protein